ncbi:hypothetical protein M3Y96_00598900 [Aphelenchoides besseyi]|nr:hypothetical protein M3Y96_00598900 [Aphelenchoides besseyi]
MKFRFSFFFLFIIYIVYAKIYANVAQRLPLDLNSIIEEPIQKPDPLFLAWKAFIQTQNDQTQKFGIDFPIDDRLYSSLKHCGVEHTSGSLPSTHTVAIRDVEIYSEIGSQSTFCRPGVSLVKNLNDTLELEAAAQIFRSQCLNSMETQSRNPTLAKIFKQMGANIEIFESNLVHHKNLQSWTRQIVRAISRTANFENRWKMILLMPGLFDVKVNGHFHTLTADILQSLQIINSHLPTKTIVLLVKNAEVSIQRDIARSFLFCEKMLTLWNIDIPRTSANWHTLEERIKQNYQTEMFYVHLIELTDGATPVIFNSTPDISILDSDCIHFSKRGVSLLHIGLYNWIAQPIKQVIWRPLVRPLFCLRPDCPFIATKENSRFCPTTRRMEKNEIKGISLFWLLALITVSLYLIILIYSLCL